MMRSLTFFALAATSTTAFQPLSVRPAFAGNTALHVSASIPHYASTTSVHLVDPQVEQASTTMEEPVTTEAPVQKEVAKKAQAKKGAKSHKEGPFSPLVILAKGVLGDETLNKVRAKAISLHSDVIGSFVETSESAFGEAVLRSFFRLADRDGNGTIEKEELKTALNSLGFDWLQDKQVSGIFKRADLDENEALDLEEWIKEAPKTLRTNLVKLAKKNGGELGFLV